MNAGKLGAESAGIALDRCGTIAPVFLDTVEIGRAAGRRKFSWAGMPEFKGSR